VEGVAREDDLPNGNNGQLIRYSESETLFIPSEKPDVKNIYEISMDIVINNDRVVKYPNGKIVILDGTKKYKIIYTENSSNETACITDINVPYNTFIELPAGTEDILDINVFIIDAYFHLIDPRKIYGHFVYLLDVHYDRKSVKSCLKEKEKEKGDYLFFEESIEDNNTFLIEENNDEILATMKGSKEEKVQILIDIEEEIL